MSSEERGLFRRRSFRCRVPEGQQGAVLTAGQRRYPVQLFNESAEGAGAWAERDPGVKADDLVELITTFGRFQARVIHVTQLDAATAEAASTAPRFRMGFEWVRELPMPPEEQDGLRRLPARSP